MANDLQALANMVVLANATGNEGLFLKAVQDLLAGVRELRAQPAAATAGWKVVAHVKRDNLGHPHAVMCSAFDANGDGLQEGAPLYVGQPAAAATVTTDAQAIRDALTNLVREAQAVADDCHRPRYARLDDAIASARAALAAPAAQQPGEDARPVAYLDIGAGGYMDVGTDLTDKQLAALPKGRHMLGIIGTYGVDGYTPQPAAQAAPAVMGASRKSTGDAR